MSSQSEAESLFAEYLARASVEGDGLLEEYCRRRPDLAEYLRELDRSVRALGNLLPRDGAASGSAKQLRMEGSVADLERRWAGREFGDFRLVRLLGSGGMGHVWEAEQRSLGKRVALKFIRPDRFDERTLQRFEREGRAGGRLQHSGIVTVFAIGEDQGLSWIAQELVGSGRTLDGFIEDARRESLQSPAYFERVARLLAQVAEALETAHRAGVIHRDIKPSNILLAEGDSPKVTDFGLARIADETALSESGDVAGTYQYMSPEQILGSRRGIDHRTDIFSLGVVLYELLTFLRPFPGDSAPQVMQRILHEDPVDPRTLRSRIPSDLAVICNKTLEKSPQRRYGSMSELALDLRRFLDHMPILAKPSSLWHRAQKWVRRHPTLSVGSAVASIAFAGLLVSFTRIVQAKARTEDLLTHAKPSYLELQAEVLWPPEGKLAPRYRKWLSDAADLRSRIGAYRSRLEALRGRASVWSPEEQRQDEARHPQAEELAVLTSRAEDLEAEIEKIGDEESRAVELSRLERIRAKVAELRNQVKERSTWSYSDPDDRALHEDLAGLVARVDRLFSPDGLVVDVERRLRMAESLEERTLTGETARKAWDVAIEGVAASSSYKGLRVTPQWGLIPIGRDPDSGLWEFAHLLTGEAPERGTNGSLRITPDSGVVLVLIPSGSFLMGRQATDKTREDHDPYAFPSESPSRVVDLDAFFLSKYELTQAQWLRMTGENPSEFQPDPFQTSEESGATLVHPVDSISWTHCAKWLPRFDLQLPTEAQWEYATRAGTSTIWWGGNELADLSDTQNIADATLGRAANYPQIVREFDDGFERTAPVATIQANPFGLHHVHGNLWEWCRDVAADYSTPPDEGDGLRSSPGTRNRVGRGGGFVNNHIFTRASVRDFRPPESIHPAYGVRPARPLR